MNYGAQASPGDIGHLVTPVPGALAWVSELVSAWHAWQQPITCQEDALLTQTQNIQILGNQPRSGTQDLGSLLALVVNLDHCPARSHSSSCLLHLPSAAWSPHILEYYIWILSQWTLHCSKDSMDPHM